MAAALQREPQRPRQKAQLSNDADASDFYVVPVFGGFGIPASVDPARVHGNGYLTFGDAYGQCSTITYVKRSVN